jgi:hypothetical protein
MAMEESAIGDEDGPGEAGFRFAGADGDAIVTGIDGATRNQDPLAEDEVDAVRIRRIVGVFSGRSGTRQFGVGRARFKLL